MQLVMNGADIQTIGRLVSVLCKMEDWQENQMEKRMVGRLGIIQSGRNKTQVRTVLM